MITDRITSGTADGVALDGAWDRPEDGAKPGTAVLLVHGKARNFSTGPSRLLAPYSVGQGFAVLAINRRGHDVIYSKPGVRDAAAGRATTAIIQGSDHYYTGREAEAGRLVADWLAKTL